MSKDLASVPQTTPVLVWSHVPIASSLPLLSRRCNATASIAISAGQVHVDSRSIVEMFAAHPNVKFCLSGHVHELEHLELKDVHYYCNGAVSGGWWKGKNHGMDEGYALIDLYDDGAFACHYVGYGWKA